MKERGSEWNRIYSEMAQHAQCNKLRERATWTGATVVGTMCFTIVSIGREKRAGKNRQRVGRDISRQDMSRLNTARPLMLP